jgi:hypothetical protein
MGKEYWVYHSHGLQGGEKTENNGKMTVLRSYLSHLWLKFQNARLVGHILVIMTRWAKNIGSITVMGYRVVKKPKITEKWLFYGHISVTYELKFQNARLVGHILVIMTRWAKNIGSITVMGYRVVKKPKITEKWLFYGHISVTYDWNFKMPGWLVIY